MGVIMIIFFIMLSFGAGFGIFNETFYNRKSMSNMSHFRIINGRKISIKETPWQVGVIISKVDRQELCGGALISHIHIITAAHCTYNYTHEHVKILKGQNNIVGKKVEYEKIVKIYEHPKYVNPNYDVAILVLAKKAVTCKSVQIIKIRNREPVPGEKIITAGWGTTEEGRSSVALKMTDLTVFPRRACEKAYKGIETITSVMFCSIGEKTDTCQGDSGGPVVINGELVGTVSWAKGCADSRYPGVNANLYRMRDFIDSSTNNMTHWV